MVFRSIQRGDDLRPISPEITRTKKGSGTALAESPLNPDVLWAGTDDGGLWVTRNGGQQWTRVDEKIGLPGPRLGRHDRGVPLRRRPGLRRLRRAPFR